jgi:tRNA A37 threonylcarbamoyladenosine synthetase subunit TsaC/SUA5/YrdC
MELVEAVIARRQHGKHVSAATDTNAAIAVTVFSARSTQRLYNKGHQQPGSHELQVSCGSSWLAVRNLHC